MNKNFWQILIIICVVTLLIVNPTGGMAQAQEEIQYISFSGGTQKSILTYGLYAALSEAGRINLGSTGSFSVNVPFAATTAPTQYKPPFTVEVMGLRMQGTWNDKDAQGTFTLTGTINTTRTTYAYLDDAMGNDEWYYVTKYQYYDNVTASGTITRAADQLVFSMDAVVNRTGNSRMDSKIVNEGQTTTGENPIITDKSGTFSETAKYSFTISAEGESVPVAEPSNPPETATPDTNECIRQPFNKNSVVRFGDLYGEVNVRRNFEDDDAYLYAFIDMNLCHQDRIRTLPRSGAILSWSDMSTFMMKEDTTIILDIDYTRPTNLEIIAGNIWVNLKLMVKNGSMEVHLSQAVAGIKGTIVIFEETGDTSTIKVIEGIVEVRPNAGVPVTLTDGNMVSVTNGIASAVMPFSIEDELQTWDENVQQMTAQELAERKSSPPLFSSSTWILISALGILCLGFIVIILLLGFNSKKKKNNINSAYQSVGVESQLVPPLSSFPPNNAGVELIQNTIPTILPTSYAESQKPPALRSPSFSGNEPTPSEQLNMNNLTQWQCSCGNMNAGLFCPKCGSAKPTPGVVQSVSVQPTYCKQCGEVLTPGARFCRNCGTEA